MTDAQHAALSWARGGILLQWPDGLWRARGCTLGDDDHDDADIRALTAMGYLRLETGGCAAITLQGRAALIGARER